MELTLPKKQLSIHDWWEMAVPLLSGIILMHIFSTGIEFTVVTGLIRLLLAAFLPHLIFP